MAFPEHAEDGAIRDLLLWKLFRIDAKVRHRQNDDYRGRRKKHDTGPHHMPFPEHDLQGQDGPLPLRRNSPRGR